MRSVIFQNTSEDRERLNRSVRVVGASLLLALLVAAAACGSGSNKPGFSNEPEAGAPDGGGVSFEGGTGPEDAPTFVGPDGSFDAVSPDDCPPSATLVYVTGVGDKLYSFFPPTLTFTLVGQFNCLSSPTHMTVDRQATAWVVAGGRIYKASTKDATCTEVSTWQPDPTFNDFALTFVGVKDPVDTTLYLLNDSRNLARFDVSSGASTPINSVDPTATLGDMTSNGDGTLYFLQDIFTPVLWNIDPQTGATIAHQALSAAGGGSQALAFWGGSFYAFENSTIYQYDPAAKTTTSLGSAPLMVTGAGQSTCVPKIPPPAK
jgi:hypothetical protein